MPKEEVIIPGAIPTDVVSLQGFVDGMSYPQMIHSVGHMDNAQYHTLQGVASGFLPSIAHPLKVPYVAALGGSFVHPIGISKVATRDILKAPNQRHLSGMLHSEYLDHQAGRNVGGGLFDSLKHVVKKGVTGLAKGAKSALGIGKKLQSALQKGTAIAKTFQEPLSAAFPKAGELLSSGVSAAEALEAGIGVGLAAGEQITGGLQTVAKAVDPESFQ